MRLARMLLATTLLASCVGGGTNTDGADANHAPTQAALGITPAHPTQGEPLTALRSFDATDPDGDPVSYAWAWSRDGEPQVDLVTDTVPAGRTLRGETWQVSVRASDGELTGPVAQASVTVENAPPTLSIAWENPAPFGEDPLTVIPTAADPDGDSLTFTYTWVLNGSTSPLVTGTIASANTTIGDSWHVDVVADDGHGGTATASLDVTIANRAPVVTNVALSPTTAGDSEDLTATATVTDADGGSLALTWAFYRNGTLFRTNPSPKIAAVVSSIGDTWRAELTVNDGFESFGPFVTNDATVADLPPTQPGVDIVPRTPQQCEGLICLTVEPYSTDPDPQQHPGDPIYSWLRNGQPWSGPGAGGREIPPSSLTAGDVWTCEVHTVSNGLSSPVGSASVTIGNGHIVDVFPMTPRASADVLLVFNASGHLWSEQQRLENALPGLVNALDARGVDYHIGAVRMDVSSNVGQMVSASTGGVFVGPATPNGATVVQGLVRTGGGGGAAPIGLSASRLALSEPLVSTTNAGFLRASGLLAVLFLSDEERAGENAQVEPYTRWIHSIRPYEDILPWAVVPLSSDCRTSGSTSYFDVAAALQGGRSSICDATYTDLMGQFADAISGLPRQLPISRKAMDGTVALTRVSAGGTRTSLLEGVDWSWSSLSGAAMLSAPPTPGEAVEVSYDLQCEPIVSEPTLDTGNTDTAATTDTRP